MKNLLVLLCCCVAVILVGAASVHAGTMPLTLVSCQGASCGGSGGSITDSRFNRDYNYVLKNNAANVQTILGDVEFAALDVPELRYFSIGILDNPVNIKDVLCPDNWGYRIMTAKEFKEFLSREDAKTDFTPKTDWDFRKHGSNTTGRWDNAPYVITWMFEGPTAIKNSDWTEPLTFGFNDKNPPKDVNWINNINECVTENLVSGGEKELFTTGPVHTPVPEPSAIVLLIVAAISLLASARRRQ